jgi:hypothetical protein
MCSYWRGGHDDSRGTPGDCCTSVCAVYRMLYVLTHRSRLPFLYVTSLAGNMNNLIRRNAISFVLNLSSFRQNTSILPSERPGDVFFLQQNRISQSHGTVSRMVTTFVFSLDFINYKFVLACRISYVPSENMGARGSSYD